MDGYLKQEDWRVHENSNVNYSLGGLILHNSGAITANYWLKTFTRVKSPTRTATGEYTSRSFHVSAYCAGWSLRQLISEGLGGVKSKSRRALPSICQRSSSRLVNFLGICRRMGGRPAVSSFDTYLAPFVGRQPSVRVI